MKTRILTLVLTCAVLCSFAANSYGATQAANPVRLMYLAANVEYYVDINYTLYMNEVQVRVNTYINDVYVPPNGRTVYLEYWKQGDLSEPSQTIELELVGESSDSECAVYEFKCFEYGCMNITPQSKYQLVYETPYGTFVDNNKSQYSDTAYYYSGSRVGNDAAHLWAERYTEDDTPIVYRRIKPKTTTISSRLSNTSIDVSKDSLFSSLFESLTRTPTKTNIKGEIIVRKAHRTVSGSDLDSSAMVHLTIDGKEVFPYNYWEASPITYYGGSEHFGAIHFKDSSPFEIYEFDIKFIDGDKDIELSISGGSSEMYQGSDGYWYYGEEFWGVDDNFERNYFFPSLTEDGPFLIMR